MTISSSSDTRELYLDLLAKTLTGYVFPESADTELKATGGNGLRSAARRRMIGLLNQRGYRLLKQRPFDEEARRVGNDWPLIGYSMVGLERMRNIRKCVETVVADGIPGDWVEAGVWRGGASMYARATLTTCGADDRTVWLADSFEGLPAPTAAADSDSPDLSENPYLAVTADAVRGNFKRFGLLDENVKFLVGWFSETLPNSPISEISVLRLDGDLYESTIDALDALYPRVSVGGFVIIDDYRNWPACARAVNEYRDRHNVSGPLMDIDGTAVYWRRD